MAARVGPVHGSQATAKASPATISPTAKAAKTVVLTESASGKTSELVALEVGVEALGVARSARRRAGRGPRSVRAAPPAQRGRADHGEGGQQRQRRHQVRREVEALARRQREHAVAVL